MAIRIRSPHSQRGFSLIEVLIALSIFSFFITAFVVGFGSNLQDSSMLEEESRLRMLCEEKVSMLKLDPPEFAESLTLTPETGTFEEEGYPDYQYSITYKRLKIPDYSAITGQKSEEEKEKEDSSIQKMVFEKLKKNLAEMVWQAQVKVNNKETDFSFTATTLLFNEKAKINVGI